MAVRLLVTKSRVAHVEGCVRLANAGHPAVVEPWDGTCPIRPCRSCLFGQQVKRRRPLPCPKCGHPIARPCPHNGVLRAVERRNGRGVQRIWSYPDLAFEREWLLSLLDS